MSKRRNRRRLKRRRQRAVRAQLLTLMTLGLILIVFGLYFLLWKPVKKEVQVEIGSDISLNDFLKKENAKAEFVTDISKIDLTKLGEYEVVVKVRRREFTSTLKIADTVAPMAEAVAVATQAEVLPEATDCVTNIEDATAVTVVYKETPDVSKEGEVKATLVLTDEGGNKTELVTTITVWVDTEPPVIEGVKTKEVTVGGTVSYRDGITVTDNADEKPTLKIDNSKVDLNKVGTYEVVYTATDASGNSTSVTSYVAVKAKEVSQVDEATVNALAQKVLDSITDSSMSDMEVAFAIYKWTNTHIGYTGTSDKSSWLQGAYQAFTKKSGDCYNYFAAAKALFRVAGIDNVDIVKSDTSHSSHFWSIINLGDGWYHVDATPRKGEGDLFFMVTDEELEAYSKAHKNSHIFDTSAYPARATKSLQSKVNYAAGKIKE